MRGAAADPHLGREPMGYEDWFRLSAHAVVTNKAGHVLQLRATYGERRWGLPGGALDHDETVHEALRRECREELGVDLEIGSLTGVYYHSEPKSHAFVFRCTLPHDASIRLSGEHDEWRFFRMAELSPVQRRRVEDCLAFDGEVRSARF